MSLVAAYAMWWKWKQGRETRFLVSEVLVIIIGLGSALFHGTLTFYGQLADELPMIWGVSVWLDSKARSNVLFRLLYGRMWCGTLKNTNMIICISGAWYLWQWDGHYSRSLSTFHTTGSLRSFSL